MTEIFLHWQTLTLEFDRKIYNNEYFGMKVQGSLFINRSEYN